MDNKPLYTLTCQKCGKEYQTNIYWSRYCSDSCRVSAYQKRRKEKVVHGQTVDKNGS